MICSENVPRPQVESGSSLKQSLTKQTVRKCMPLNMRITYVFAESVWSLLFGSPWM